jgi:hypothetical protein
MSDLSEPTSPRGGPVVTAMLAVGFALGGAVAAVLSPRAAGGVFLTLLVAGVAVRHARRRQPPLRRAMTASIRP